MELIMKLVKCLPITYKDIENELYEICDRVHGSCGSDCPIYAHGAVLKDPDGRMPTGCPYHKDGHKMRMALEKVKI